MTTTDRPHLNPQAAAALHGASWEPVTSGRRSRVWHATFDDGRPDLAIKAGVRIENEDLAPDGRPGGQSDGQSGEARALIHAEARRMAWIAEHLQGRGLKLPEVVAVPEPDDTDPVLVTGWLEGTVDPRLMRTPEIAVEGFGRALASLHEASRRIDLDACPFDASLQTRLAQARVRVEAGLVDLSDAQDPYDHYTPRALLERIQAMADATRPPTPEDRVLVHGDLCVSNIVFDPAYSTTVGALDWAFAGVGDRHQDLAITARSLARNLSGEVLPDFFAAYGLGEPDLLRIETYVALEELF